MSLYNTRSRVQLVTQGVNIVFLTESFRFQMSTGIKALAHMTAVYLGNIPEAEKVKAAYDKLHNEVGQVAKIDVTAVVVTPRTVSARIKLRTTARRLYFNDDPGGSNAYMEKAGKTCYDPVTAVTSDIYICWVSDSIFRIENTSSLY